MKTMIYNKLVRDKIPEIITKQGNTCKVRTLSPEEYLEKLDEKLCEELGEYQHSKDLEELADLLEVMEAVVLARGESWQTLVALRDAKRRSRGGFSQRILLQEVTQQK